MMHISALFVLASAEQVHGRRSMAFVGHCALPGAVQAPAKNDGQDGTVAGQAPHTQVFRDGYWSVGCRFDAMQTEGDKYGNEADMYDLGRSANTSVVRYDEILDKENQKPMTPRVCFDFCRTVPEMQFFGLIHGRDCYCMHYYRNAAGGSGVCDLPCDGDSAKTCGGEGKSSIYQMHACEGGLEQDMQDTMADAETVLDAVGKALTVTTDVATAMQASGDALESLAEATASPLAQEAKTVAGPLTRTAEDLASLNSEFEAALGEGGGMAELDSKSFENRKKIEGLMAHSEDILDAADEALPAAGEWVEKTQPNITLGEDFNNTFVPILRQVDPAEERKQSVCTGDLTGAPIVGLSYDECTAACDALAPKSSEEHCISVQYVDFPANDPLCFMYKKLKELTVFNCDYEGDGASAAAPVEKESTEEKVFLQVARKHIKKHSKKHGKHGKHAKHVRKHRAPVEITEQKHQRVMLSHPSSKYALEEKFGVYHSAVVAKVESTSTFCAIRYSSTYGVTPKFFDGMTKLERCFGAE